MEKDERKRQFLLWLTMNFKHQNASVNYLLIYLSKHLELMKSLKFSEGAKYAPRGIYISYQTNSSLSFIYYKDQLSFTLSDQAFHDIRLNHRVYQNDFYVELNIPNSYQELYRFDIFEENPYVPENIRALKYLEDQLLQISIEAKLNILHQNLNKALLEHNFDEVTYYLSQIEKLKED
ncbi:YpiB family protein [Aerococcaceae bacterium WGS1372]